MLFSQTGCDLTSPGLKEDATTTLEKEYDTFEILSVDPPDGARNVTHSNTFRITVKFTAVPVGYEGKLTASGGLQITAGSQKKAPYENVVVYNLNSTPTAGQNYIFTLAGGIQTDEEDFADDITPEVVWDFTFADPSTAAAAYPGTAAQSNDCSGLDVLTGNCWVYLPGGTLTLGDDSSGDLDIAPAHNVYIDPFYVSKFELTNAHHRQCVTDGLCSAMPGAYKNSRYTRKTYINNILEVTYPGPPESELFTVTYNRGATSEPQPLFSYQSGKIDLRFTNTTYNYFESLQINALTTFDDVKRALECGQPCDYKYYLPDEACASPVNLGGTDYCPIAFNLYEETVDNTDPAYTKSLMNVTFNRGNTTADLPTLSFDGNTFTMEWAGDAGYEDTFSINPVTTTMADLETALEAFTLPAGACQSGTCTVTVTIDPLADADLNGLETDLVVNHLIDPFSNKPFGAAANFEDSNDYSYTYKTGFYEKRFSKLTETISQTNFGGAGEEFVYNLAPVYPNLKFDGSALTLGYQNLLSGQTLTSTSDTATLNVNSCSGSPCTFSDVKTWIESYMIPNFGCTNTSADCAITANVKGGYETSVVNVLLPEFAKADFGTSNPLQLFGAEAVVYYEDAQFDNFPVVNLTLEESRQLCDWYDDGLSNSSATVPTEAHWEFAAVGATTTIYNEFGQLEEDPFPASAFNLDLDLNDPGYNLTDIPAPCSHANYFQNYDYNILDYITGPPSKPNRFFQSLYCQTSLNGYEVPATDNLLTVTYPTVQDDQAPATIEYTNNASCSNASYTNRVNCENNGETWTEATTGTFTVRWIKQECTDPAYTDQSSCLGAGTCDTGGYTNQQDCESNSGVWTPASPAERWETKHECSNATYTNYTDCVGNGATWDEVACDAGREVAGECIEASFDPGVTGDGSLAAVQSTLSEVILPADSCVDTANAVEQCRLNVTVGSLPHPFGLSGVAPGNPDALAALAPFAEKTMPSFATIPGGSLGFLDITDTWAVNNRPSPLPGHTDLRIAPVGNGGASADYIYGMMGNVWEWTTSGYQSYPLPNRIEPGGDDLSQFTYAVIKGGGNASGVDDIQAVARGKKAPDSRSADVGVRCVKYSITHTGL